MKYVKLYWNDTLSRREYKDHDVTANNQLLWESSSTSLLAANTQN